MIDLCFKILEWTGSVLGLVGAILLTKKQKFGFIIFSVFNLLWFSLGIYRNEYGMAFLMMAYLVVNLYGYVKWAREARRDAVSEVRGDLN